jgi:hypothetical protein
VSLLDVCRLPALYLSTKSCCFDVLQKHSKLMVGQLLNRPTPAHQKRFFKGHKSSSPAADKAGTAEEAAAAAAAAGENAPAGQAPAAAANVASSDVEQVPHTGMEELKQQQQQTQGSAASAA